MWIIARMWSINYGYIFSLIDFCATWMEQKYSFYLGRSWGNIVTVPSIALCAACDCFQTLEGALDLKKQKRTFLKWMCGLPSLIFWLCISSNKNDTCMHLWVSEQSVTFLLNGLGKCLALPVSSYFVFLVFKCLHCR